MNKSWDERLKDTEAIYRVTVNADLYKRNSQFFIEAQQFKGRVSSMRSKYPIIKSR